MNITEASKRAEVVVNHACHLCRCLEKKERERAREYTKEWKKRNQEKVRAQNHRYRERKAWPRIPRTIQRKPCRYDQDKIVLFDSRVEITDFRKTATQSTNNPQNLDEFDPDEFLMGMFPPKTPERKQDSTDSETDKELARELEEVLAEPEDPVRRRIRQIKKNRKKAEKTRIQRMLIRHKEEEMIAEIASELDKTMLMLNDMCKRFTAFEREDTVERASQFEYSRTVEITTELMSELEQYLFR